MQIDDRDEHERPSFWLFTNAKWNTWTGPESDEGQRLGREHRTEPTDFSPTWSNRCPCLWTASDFACLQLLFGGKMAVPLMNYEQVLHQ
jgi:hypothetical protein